MNKRGESSNEWPLSKVVTLILLVILLVLLILGLVTGKLNPLFDKVGGVVNSVLVQLGIRNSTGGSGSSNDGCVYGAASFTLKSGKVESVVLAHCFRGGRETCSLKTFELRDSIYTYTPITGQLFVSRNDHRTKVDLENTVSTSSNGTVTPNEVFYNGVAYLYSLYGITSAKSGRKWSYDVGNYINSNMDDSFGQFQDLFVMHGGNSQNYLMESNGLFLILDEKKFDNQGQGWWYRNAPAFLGGSHTEVERNFYKKFVTPISASDEERGDSYGLTYVGYGPNTPLNKIYEIYTAGKNDAIN